MTLSAYAQLIDVKRWADLGLCEVVGRRLAELSEQEAAVMISIFDHIHAVDRIFQHHLLGRPHTYQAARSAAPPTFDVLTKSMKEVDDWYVSYVAGLSPDDLDEHVDFTFTSGKPARMRRGEILLHVCLNGTYHRGNAGAVLQLKGLTPSRDAVTDYLEDAFGLSASPA